MLALFARCPCHSRLWTLRRLATNAVNTNEAASSTLAEASTSASANETSAPTAEHPRTGRATPLTLGDVQDATQLCSAGPQRVPAWWSDENVDAYDAYKIIMNRFRRHGSQREENYRQMINRVKTPEDAALALTILDQGRKARALLEQHVPFTHHTSNLFVMTCVKVKAFASALEALQRAQELGLQFFRADAYYAVMKGAALDRQLDLAIRTFETMKQNGVRPGGKVVHNLIMGSIINGRRDLAEAFAEEFRYNGIKINKASAEWLDGVRKPADEGVKELDGSKDGKELPSEQQEKTAAVTSA